MFCPYTVYVQWHTTLDLPIRSYHFDPLLSVWTGRRLDQRWEITTAFLKKTSRLSDTFLASLTRLWWSRGSGNWPLQLESRRFLLCGCFKDLVQSRADVANVGNSFLYLERNLMLYMGFYCALWRANLQHIIKVVGVHGMAWHDYLPIQCKNTIGFHLFLDLIST